MAQKEVRQAVEKASVNFENTGADSCQNYECQKCFWRRFGHKRKCQSLSLVRLFVTPWTVAHQAPLSMEFSRQEYWSGFQTEMRNMLLETGNVLVALLCLSLRSYGLQSARLCWSWNSPGKNTGVGNFFLLLGIFPTQRLNLGLLHCKQIL